MSYSSFSMSTRRKEAFSEELGTMLGRRSVMTSSEEHHITTFFRQQSEEFGGVEIQEILDEVADIFVVTHNFRADSVDAISLRKGDLVEVVDTGNDSAKRLRLDPDLDLGDLSSLLDNSAARHKLSVRPRRKHTDSRQRDSGLEETRWLVRSMDDPTLQGWVPASVLERSNGEELTKHSELSRPEVAQSRREAAVRELVETEEEFGRDLQQVVERYQKPLDNTSVPHVVRENRDVIFSNFKQIADFHNTSPTSGNPVGDVVGRSLSPKRESLMLKVGCVVEF
uniref:(California timema) hypothetical protein n=1 Tax=Timema californicum TaxID=61474 RepID=A0A7R9IYA2_TIMCA|nr:unnamed protein product [Timema californicum]